MIGIAGDEKGSLRYLGMTSMTMDDWMTSMTRDDWDD